MTFRDAQGARGDFLSMAGWKALLLAASLVALSGRSASAVDLPPIPTLPAAQPGADEFAGFYLRGDVGAAINVSSTLREEAGVPSGVVSPHAVQAFRNTTLSSSGAVDIGAGYQFDPWLRMDGTLEYRAGASLHTLYTLAGPASSPFGGAFLSEGAARGDLSSVIGLINSYVDLPVAWGLTPFVGAGLGFADNTATGFTARGFAYGGSGALGYSGGSFSNGSKTSFAWALMAGIDFAVLPNVKLELSYRYLNTGSFTTGTSNGMCLVGGAPSGVVCGSGGGAVVSRHALASNDIRFGLIWTIGEAAPPRSAAAARGD